MTETRPTSLKQGSYMSVYGTAGIEILLDRNLTTTPYASLIVRSLAPRLDTCRMPAEGFMHSRARVILIVEPPLVFGADDRIHYLML